MLLQGGFNQECRRCKYSGHSSRVGARRRGSGKSLQVSPRMATVASFLLSRDMVSSQDFVRKCEPFWSGAFSVSVIGCPWTMQTHVHSQYTYRDKMAVPKLGKEEVSS